jgi:Domain of unknown function (DUF4276)
MKHLVCLLEEPSAQDALQHWLPDWLPGEVQFHFIVFQGKQDLERNMVRRIRFWLKPDSRFLVLRDQDSADCRTVKKALAARCAEAGRNDSIVRVACTELESFFLGDWQAVAQAYNKPALARLAAKAVYRDPDRIGSPSAELLRHIPSYQKRDGARRIAPYVDPRRNASGSFQALHRAVLRLAKAR